LFTGLTLALLLGFSKRIGQTGNLFLSSALTVVVLDTGGLTSLFLPALGPLLYIYTRQLTSPDQRFNRKDILHFCPLLVGLWMPTWVIVISVIIYLYLSHRKIQDFYSRLRPVLMDRSRFAFRRLERAFVLLGLFCVFALVNDVFWFAVAFVLIGITVEAMLKPDIGAQLTMPITDRSDAREKGRRLKEAVAANRIYGDAELTLATLAVKLMIHPHDLSRIMNIGLEKNFSDFINEFRVREIAQKMRDPAYDRLTLLGIAYESGFNSQRTFHRVFKEMTGKTPLEYKNSLRKELPIDKLAVPSRIRPVILRSESPLHWAPETLKRNMMIRNYFKTAGRILWRNKIYTSINVLGLALGICACVAIRLIAGYELSFDTFHPDGDRIYRVMTTMHFAAGDQDVMSKVPFSSVAAARSEVPGVEAISAVSMYYAKIGVHDGNKPIKKFDSSIDGAYYPGTIVAEPQYFKIFSYHWLAGNKETALNQPYKVVLTLGRAQKYFGNADPGSLVGKEIVYDDSLRVQISGIVEDWKKNTDFAFTDFISYSTVQNSFLKKAFADDWNHMSTQAFVKLAPGTSQDKVNAGLAAIVKTYAPKNPDIKLNLWLEPITKVHFDADVVENQIRTADRPIVYSMIGTAVFILLLALVNFVNLATAQSIQRVREMGVRKIMGSSKTGIMIQFMTETFLVTFFALIIALFLVNPALTAFKAFIPQGVSFRLLENNTLLFTLAITLITCLFAGLYPARALAAHAPALSLRGTATPGGGHWWLRKGLIVFQFTLSLVFIIGSLVVHQQLSYTRGKAMGFNTDAIVILPTSRKAPAKQMNVLAQQLKQIPGVSNVASEQYTPMDGRDGNIALKLNGVNGTETRIPELSGDEHYLSLYSIKLLAGRNLLPADSLKEYVINETFLHLLGLHEPREAIGKMLLYKNKPYPIVGVVADFHEKSFHETIKPVCIVNIPKMQQDIAVKLAASGKQAAALKVTLAHIEKSWKAMYPGEVFDFRFFDQSIALLYEKDYRTAKLINAAAFIVIFISCIGLFGLTIFTTKRRTAEIGIRKVLGASVSNITLMLSKDFVVLVLAALIVASPVAWYLMNRWLENFVYRIAISWWMFALSGILAIIIALITISFQTINAAIMNPVKSLRSE